MDDPFKPDPFLEVVARSMGRIYPSAGAVKWADKLAAQYGEEMVMKALAKAALETDPGHVLTLAEEMLEFAAANQERIVEREKEEELAQAREDRNRREMEYLRSVTPSVEAIGTGQPKPLREIMGDLPWLKKKE